MPALAPHLGLFDPARASGLDRRADPLARGRASSKSAAAARPSSAPGFSSLRNPLELTEHLARTRFPLGDGHRPGKQNHYTNICSPVEPYGRRRRLRVDHDPDAREHCEHEDRGHHDEGGDLPRRPSPAVGAHTFGYSTIWVQRCRAIVRPVASFVTVTSHTRASCDRCAPGRPRRRSPHPAAALPRKFVLSSTVVNVAPSVEVGAK